MEHDAPIDPDRIALGIQQPWVELILRGTKTLEIRSQPTRQRGLIYLYASKRASSLAVATRHRIDVPTLPFGVLVGTARLIDCRPCRPKDQHAACVTPQLLEGQFTWELSEPRSFSVPLAVRFLPYGVWFYPFKRRSVGQSRRRTK